MPKQTRWAIKQGMDQAINDLDRASNNLVHEGMRFEGHESDYFDKFKALIQAIESIKQATTDLRDSI